MDENNERWFRIPLAVNYNNRYREKLDYLLCRYVGQELSEIKKYWIDISYLELAIVYIALRFKRLIEGGVVTFSRENLIKKFSLIIGSIISWNYSVINCAILRLIRDMKVIFVVLSRYKKEIIKKRWYSGFFFFLLNVISLVLFVGKFR